MERIYNAVRKINHVGGTLSGTFAMIMGIIVTYEVVMRYLFRSPTTWVFEMTIILNIAVTFLAGSLAMQDKMHVRVDFITLRLSRHNQHLFELFSLFLSFIFCLVLAWKGTTLVMRSIAIREVSVTLLHIPMAVSYVFVPLGSIMFMLEIFCQFMKEVSAYRTFSMKEEKLGSWLARNRATLILLILTALSLVLFLSRELAWIGVTGLLFVLMFGGLPIVFATGLIGLAGFYLTFGGGPIVDQIPVIALRIMDDFVVCAIPLFVMLAMVLNVGKIGERLFEVSSTLLRHIPGGLGVATMLSIAVFSAISGSTSATIATFSLIAIPVMVAQGYKKTFSYGIVASGAVMDPLIPPSGLMILLSTVSGDSIGALYLAGVFPGILIGIIFSGYIILKSWRGGIVNELPAASWKERWDAIRKSFWGLMAPVIILGGIYSGIFTPTESAGVGVLYSLFICGFIYRSLSLRKLSQIVLSAGKLTSLILYITVGALAFGQVVLMLRLPDHLLQYLSTLRISPMLILWASLFLVLVLGALMDEVSILFIVFPFLYYIFVKGFSFDPIWFSIVFLVTLEVGLIAPPVGYNIFILQGVVPGAKFEEVVKGVLPFLFLMIGSILFMVYVKPLSTWLPGLMFKW